MKIKLESYMSNFDLEVKMGEKNPLDLVDSEPNNTLNNNNTSIVKKRFMQYLRKRNVKLGDDGRFPPKMTEKTINDIRREFEDSFKGSKVDIKSEYQGGEKFFFLKDVTYERSETK